MRSKTPLRRVLFPHWLILAGSGLFIAFLFALSTIFIASPIALASTSNTVNFQARLMTASGSIVPDGTYNIEFKLYNEASGDSSSQGSCTGDSHCLWYEDYLVSASQGVQVSNGYLTVNLGSINPFSSATNTINWGQPLFLTMNIGGTVSSPTWDGEMSPRLPLTSVPSAFALQSPNSGTYTSTLSFVQPTASEQILLPAESGATEYVCYQNDTSCGFALSTGSGSYIQNGTTQQTSANYNISGTGQLSTLDATGAGTANTLTIGSSASTTGTINFGTSMTSGVINIGGNSQTGTIILGNSGSANILDIANGGGATTVNIANNQSGGAVNAGGSLTTGSITVGGTTQTGTTTIGRSTSTNTISLGGGAETGTQTIGIGNGSDSGSGNSQVTIGNTNGASKVTLNAGTGNVDIYDSGGAAGASAQPAASTQYVESRGQNLITNGSGLLGDNYNFPSFAFDPTDTYSGGGSFLINVAQQAEFSSELMPVDPSQTYLESGWGKSGDIGGANYYTSNVQYLGLVEFDIDGNEITPSDFTKYPGSTDTTLAQALTPGATQVFLNNASGWSNGSGERGFSWWPYTSASGQEYANYTYTRNVTGDNTWVAGGISGNTITLNPAVYPSGWNGATLPIGTPIRDHDDGGTFEYTAAAAVAIPNAWTNYSGSIGGLDTTGAVANETHQFAEGASYVKLLFLVNYQGSANNDVRWSDLSFTDINTGNLTLYKPAASYDDSTSYFQIQSSAGSEILAADTVDNEVDVNTLDAITSGGTLDIGGINTATGAIVIGPTSTTGTITVGGAAQTGAIYVDNSNSANTLNLASGSGNTTVNVANTQTGGSVNIGGAMTTGTISIGSTAQTGSIVMQSDQIAQTVTGSATAPSYAIKTLTNSANAFAVQNSTGVGILQVNTSSGTVYVDGTGTFGSNSWLNIDDTGGGNGRFAITGTGSDDFGGAFLFRNNAGTTQYAEFTTTGNLDIGNTNNTYKLDVSGIVNSSTGYDIAGTPICTSTGCTATSGSGSYIQNSTTQQTANFNVVSAAAGSIGGLIQGAASATQPVLVVEGGATPSTGGNLLQLEASGSSVLDTFNSAGYLGIGTSASTTQGLVLQAAGGANLDATGSTSGATTTGTNWVEAPKDDVTLFLGSGASASGDGANDNDGDIRFSGAGVAWGDLGYYPIGGNSGIFRFSTAGSSINTTPNAKVGVGGLYSNGSVGIDTASPGYPLDVVGDINTSTEYDIGGNATLTSSALSFGAASTASIQSASSQSLNITANNNSTWSTNSGTLTIQGANTLSLLTGNGGTSAGINIESGNASSGASGNIVIDNGTSTSGTPAVSIGTTNARTIQIGNTTGATSLAESVGTGNYTLNGVGATTYTIGAATTTGTIAIGGTAQTGSITLGSSTGISSVLIGNGTGTSTVNIANAGTADVVNIGAAMTTGSITIGGTGAQTGAISIGTGTGAQSLSFGTGGTAAKTVTVGSTASTSSTVIQSGTGNLQLATQGTGILGVGNNGVAQTIQIGNTTGATSLAESVGTGNYTLNGVGATTYTIGAATTTGTIAIGGTAQTGSITLGSSTGISSVLIGNGTGTSTVNIANAGTADVVNIGAAMTTGSITIGGTGAQTGAISIGTGTGAQSLSFGTGGTAAKTVTVGSTASTSSTVIQSGTGNLQLATQGTGILGVGNNGVAQTIQIGNTTGATSLAESVGTGNYTLNGVGATTYTIGAATTTGTIAIGGTAQTGSITLGSSTGISSVLIGNGTGTSTVNIANAGTADVVNIGAAMTTGSITIGGTGAQTGAISIGTGTGAQSLSFGTGGTAAKTVTVGSTASTSSTVIQSGTGNLQLATQGTGILGVGNNGVAQTIQIGNTTGATSLAESVGTGNYTLNGVGATTYTIGAATTTGTIAIGGTAQTGSITLGSSTGISSVLIGNGTGTSTVNIANAGTADVVNIGAAMTTGSITIGGTGAQTGAISIGTGTGAQSLSFGTGGTAAKTVTVGSTASTSSTVIQSGTGNLQLATQGTGILGVGNNGVAQTIQIGNTTGATSLAESVGTGNYTLNGVGATTYTIGAATTTGTIAIGGTAQTGTTTLGQSTASNTINIGSSASLGSGNTQTINVGTSSNSGSTTNVTVGSTTSGSTTKLQAGATSESISNTGDILQTASNSTTAFEIQNASAEPIVVVDTTTPDLVTNPGFEVNTTGWAASGTGATIARNTTKADVYYGQASLGVSLGSGTGTGATTTSFTSTLSPGTYTLSFYAMGSAALSGLAVGISGGSTTCSLNSTAVSSTGFQQYYCTFNSTSTNITALTFTVTTTSSTLYLDSIQLSATSTVGPYQLGTIQLRGVITNPQDFEATSNSTTAFQVQNASANDVLSVDTVNGQLILGAANKVNGTLEFSNSSNANTVTLVSGATSGTYSLTLPTTGPGTSQCLESGSSTPSLLTFVACAPATGSTSYIQNGTTQQTSANYNISGTGQLSTLDATGAGTANTLTIGSSASTTGAITIGAAMTTGSITIGGTGAQTGAISIGTGTGAQSLSFGTGGTAAKTVTVGSTASTSSTVIQSGTGNLQLATQGTGILGVGNNGVAQTIQIGNTTGATSLAESVGTGNYTLNGVGATTYTIGAATTTGTIAIGGTAQTGTTTLGQSTASNTINIGSSASLGSGNTQTINVGTSSNSGSTTNVTVGSTTSGSTTTVQAGGVNEILNNTGDTLGSTTNTNATFQVQNVTNTNVLNVSTVNTNLLTNPNFDNDTTTGWASDGAASFTLNTTGTDIYAGNYSLAVGLGAGSGTGAEITSAGYSGGSLPGSTTYIFGFYAMSSASVTGLSVSGFNGGTCTLNNTTVSSNLFQHYYCTVTPTGTTTGNITITATTASATIYINGAILTTSTSESYDPGSIQLLGIVTSPVVFQSLSQSVNAFQIVDANNATVFNVDTSGSGTGVVIRSPNNNNSAFHVQDSAQNNLLSVDTTHNDVIIGNGSAGGDPTPILLELDSETGGGAEPTEVDGAMYYNATDLSFRCGENGVWRSCLGGLVNSDTSPSSPIVNTNTLTDFSGGTNNTYSMLANDCEPGVVYDITAQGVYSTGGVYTLTFELNLNSTSTVLATTGAISTGGNGSSNYGWEFTGQLICDTTGTSGTAEVQGTVTLDTAGGSAGTTATTAVMANTTTQTIATNSANTLEVGAKWSTASASNTITMRQFIVQRLGP